MPDLFERLNAAPLSVSEVNQQARQLLERHLARVAVLGEISNLKTVSGHRYLTLKDATSQLAAVLFRRDAEALRFALEDGLRVVATGRLTIYAPYGRYQMVIERVEPQGAGALQLAFEQLKSRLDQEGLFAAERKRALPLVPHRVAVVTSATGAVMRDIIHVATRRYPRADLLLIPARVQGPTSATSIVAALNHVAGHATHLGVDLIIVARGGGSLEDLWGFNDETVVRAIAAMPVPVVSAVGHETDYTLADFVADRRAPTPSAAAEIVFPVYSELLSDLRRPIDRAARALRRDLSGQRHRLSSLRARLGDGRRVVHDGQQRLALVQMRAGEALRRRVLRQRLQIVELNGRFESLHPRARLTHMRGSLRLVEERLVRAAKARIERQRTAIGAMQRRLDALSPLGVLERGYSIVLDARGHAVGRAADLRVGDEIQIRLAQGRLEAVVRATHPPDEDRPGSA